MFGHVAEEPNQYRFGRGLATRVDVLPQEQRLARIGVIVPRCRELCFDGQSIKCGEAKG